MNAQFFKTIIAVKISHPTKRNLIYLSVDNARIVPVAVMIPLIIQKRITTVNSAHRFVQMVMDWGDFENFSLKNFFEKLNHY